MSRRLQFRKEELSSEHIAIRAWQNLCNSSSIPTSVELLLNAKGRPPNRKTRIYRLSGAAVEGNTVIAKLAASDTIDVEHFVYKDVLPSIRVPCLKCYGRVTHDNTRAWLFLEEALGKRYDEDSAPDRQLASKTLARIHTATTDMDLSGQLPKHDADRYVSCLKNGRQLIRENMDNPAFCQDDISLLNSISSMLEQVERIWPDLENALSKMPQCLVHGDFVGKNVFIDKKRAPHSMYVIDWDIAGWGAPAFDIERLPLTHYRRYCKSRWHYIEKDEFDFMATVGQIFRNIGLIQATSQSLCYDWVADAIRDLQTYGAFLNKALDRYGVS